MFGITSFETFLIAGIILNLTPGSDTFYILGRSLSQGAKAGVFSVWGISSGAMLHCIFAALGLSILLAKSALAFEIIKYTGALYLIFLGVKGFLSKPHDTFAVKHDSTPNSYSQIYYAGLLTNILNPKVALFFLAFLPQFIDPVYNYKAISFLLLGLTFVCTGTIWCLCLALFSASVFRKIRQVQKGNHWLQKMSGGIFMALGVKLALSKA